MLGPEEPQAILPWVRAVSGQAWPSTVEVDVLTAPGMDATLQSWNWRVTRELPAFARLSLREGPAPPQELTLRQASDEQGLAGFVRVRTFRSYVPPEA